MIPSQASMCLDIAFWDPIKVPTALLDAGKSYKVIEIEQCKGDHLLSKEPTNIKTINFTDLNI